MLTVYHQITIKTLDKQGKPHTHIARELGCHRNTVRNVIKRKEVVEKQNRHKPSYFDAYRDKIKELLDKKTTRLRIQKILNEECGVDLPTPPEGRYGQTGRSYDSLCKYIQKHFPKPVKAFGVQTVEPGEVVEIDFGYLGMLSALLPPGVGSNLEGKLIKAWGLVMVLSYSRKLYAQITYDQKLGSLVAAVKNGFEFFGGVPKRTKVDNMKTAIAKNQHYDLEFNQDFLEFTNHYGTAILPCSPYHPEQ
jgi:transposase